MSRQLFKLLGLSAIALVFAVPGQAEVLRAKFNPAVMDPLGIEWDQTPETRDPLIRPERNGAQGSISRYTVRLKGKHPKESGVVYLDKTIKGDGQGNFTIDIEIKSAQQIFALKVIDQRGVAKAQTYRVTVSRWKEMVAIQAKSGTQKSWSITPAVGVSSISYSQTSVISLSEIAVTAKASIKYSLSSRWQISGNAFYTVVPLTTSIAGKSLRFLGANLRAGYLVPLSGGAASGWNLYLNGGWYYTTCFSTPQNLGYSNVQGPQLYPAISRDFASGRAVSAYVKYSPVFSGTSFLALSNRELALGGEFRFLGAKNGRGSMAVSLDMTNLTLNLTRGSIQANTYTLGLGYTL